MSHAQGGDAGRHMDKIYRSQRHIYDLTRKYYLLGRDKMIAELDVFENASVLEVACGTGRNLIQIAQKYPQGRFFGFDISEEMLITARQSVARAGLDERIKLAVGDATCFNGGDMFGQDKFDRIVVSYAFSMIPPWEQALDHCYECLAPGGSLHIVDFGQQNDLPALFKKGLVAWLKKFSVHPRAELPERLEKLAAEKDAELHFEHLYKDYAHYAVLRRK